MRKPDFERCTSEATKLLYDQDISNRILNVQKLVYNKNIVFDSLQNYCSLLHKPITDFLSEDKQTLKDGCTIYHPEYDCYIVLYNEEVRYFEHLNWTLGHEVGHIYLGHTTDGDIEEVEAHYFASQLFMPDYTLYRLSLEHKELIANDIAEIFGVSEEAAQRRIDTMKKRTYFCASKKAVEIWEAQKERIDLYYRCKEDGSDYRNTLSFFLDMKADFEWQCILESRSLW